MKIPTYTQYGPITNGGVRAHSDGGVRAHGDATVRYRTILRVPGLPPKKHSKLLV